jgi:hypothetical protein
MWIAIDYFARWKANEAPTGLSYLPELGMAMVRLFDTVLARSGNVYGLLVKSRVLGHGYLCGSDPIHPDLLQLACPIRCVPASLLVLYPGRWSRAECLATVFSAGLI